MFARCTQYQAIVQVQEIRVQNYNTTDSTPLEELPRSQSLSVAAEQTAMAVGTQSLGRDYTRKPESRTDATEHATLPTPKLLSKEERVVADVECKEKTSQVRVTTTLANASCLPGCKCQCHHRTLIRTPHWLKSVLGTMLYSYTGTAIIRTTPCDYPPCRRGTQKSIFAYYFPSWALTRALMISSSWDALSGVGSSWVVRMPVIVPTSHPLWHAVTQGNIEYLQNRFSNGEANVYTVNEHGFSMLHYAVNYDQPRAYRFLLQHGADDTAEDEFGALPIATAIGREKFLEYPIDVQDVGERMGFTPLHFAVTYLSKTPLLETLESHYKSIDTPDRCGMTPLHWACFCSNVDAVKLLIEWKVKVNVVDSKRRSPLHLACWAGNIESVQALLTAGCSTRLEDFHRETALYTASDPSITELLLQHGAVATHKARYGWTALHTAARFNRPRCAAVLLRYGAEVNAQDYDGYTAPMRAISYDSAEALAVMLEHKADLSLKSKAQENVLHIAGSLAGLNILRLLSMQHLGGLEPDATDRNYNTPGMCFYTRRDEQYMAHKASFDQEERAWVTLISEARNESKYFSPPAASNTFSNSDEAFMDALEDLETGAPNPI